MEEKKKEVTIEGRIVGEGDLGKEVTFVYTHGEKQHGFITGIGRRTGTVYARFKGPNGELCDGSQLRWGHV